MSKRRLLSDMERHRQPNLKPFIFKLSKSRFEDLLQNLKADRGSICEAMVFALNNAEAAEEVVEMVIQSLCQLETPVALKIARLFVVSDILHNSSASVRNASQYRTRFQNELPDVFENFQAVHATLHEKKDVQETMKKYVLRILRIWRNWYIFSNDYLNGLQSTFLALVVSEEDMSVQLKKLEGVVDDEIERKCRLNGLSLKGGRHQQKMRYARLEAYLQATPSSQPAQKKQKTTRVKRQTQLLPVRKEPAKQKKPTETKSSGWVAVSREQEKKPAMPVSQWLQNKQTLSEKPEAPVKTVPAPKPVVRVAPANQDIDMFEADDPTEPMEGVELTGDARMPSVPEKLNQKRQRSDHGL